MNTAAKAAEERLMHALEKRQVVKVEFENEEDRKEFREIANELGFSEKGMAIGIISDFLYQKKEELPQPDYL